MSRSSAKSAFFYGSKTALSKFTQLFLPQFFGHGVAPGCSEMLQFQLQLSHDTARKKISVLFRVQSSTLSKKKFCSQIFIKMYFFGKVTMLVMIQLD